MDDVVRLCVQHIRAGAVRLELGVEQLARAEPHHCHAIANCGRQGVAFARHRLMLIHARAELHEQLRGSSDTGALMQFRWRRGSVRVGREDSATETRESHGRCQREPQRRVSQLPSHETPSPVGMSSSTRERWLTSLTRRGRLLNGHLAGSVRRWSARRRQTERLGQALPNGLRSSSLDRVICNLPKMTHSPRRGGPRYWMILSDRTATGSVNREQLTSGSSMLQSPVRPGPAPSFERGHTGGAPAPEVLATRSG